MNGLVGTFIITQLWVKKFEPEASALQGQRSSQLSYEPMYENEKALNVVVARVKVSSFLKVRKIKKRR